jgi:deazaflavin-dependent oxidoreductase (nitroreductase family)
LIFRADDGRWVIVASPGGTPENPSWFANLQADPQVTIQVRRETIPVRAEAAAGAERERLWSLMTEVSPAYDDYQARTERELPVVVLTPTLGAIGRASRSGAVRYRDAQCCREMGDGRTVNCSASGGNDERFLHQ